MIAPLPIRLNDTRRIEGTRDKSERRSSCSDTDARALLTL